MIYIITYNYKHRKTQDLLFSLFLKGYKNVSVLATPWVKRKNFIPLIPHRNFPPANIDIELFCKKLNYQFQKIEIKNINLKISFDKEDLILIGGAGILPKEIIDNVNIINSHPAYLPSVRGLDALKWAIYNDMPIGVTSHIISEEADSGFLIRRELVPLYNWDTFHSIAYRQYEMEIDFLSSSIKDIKKASLDSLSLEESKVMRRMPHSKEKELFTKVTEYIKKNLDG